MDEKVAHDTLDEALQRCGSNWDAAQTHGLLTGRLAVAGVPAGPDWLLQVLENTDESNALRAECQKLLDTLYQSTYWQLSERLSEFEPLLPDDDDAVSRRTTALAHWSEGFLHGLVSSGHAEELKQRLGEEPLSDIIRDMLEITRAGLDEDTDDEDNEAAYTEIVEYLRVAAQLSFEELADLRNKDATPNEQ
jgi:yecA family protein